MAQTTWALSNAEKAKVVARSAARTTPEAADQILEFFSSTGPLQTTLKNTQASVKKFGDTINGTHLATDGKINEEIYRRLKYQYSNLYVATGAGAVSNSIGKASAGIHTALDNAEKSIDEALKPVSSFIGSSLGTLTGMLRDPIGTVTNLPNTVGSMSDKLNPELRAKYEATYKKFHIDKLAEMPGQIFGSIQQIAKTIDGILSVPITLISDIYKGIMEIMNAIQDFVNELFTAISKFITKIIDDLFPGLTDFLSALSDFANQIGGIAQVFSGSTQVLGFINQGLAFSNQLNGFIQNPMNAAFAYLPSNVNSYINAIQTPQAFVNQFLPPQLSQYMAKMSSVTGFGFNGNMGFGLQSVLQGVQGGVLASVASGFGTQFSILAPLLGQSSASKTSTSHTNDTGVIQPPNGPGYSVDKTGGTVVQTTPPRPQYGGKTANN